MEIECWRCGLAYSKFEQRCLHCDARNRIVSQREHPAPKKTSARSLEPIPIILITYGILHLIVVVMSLIWILQSTYNYSLGETDFLVVTTVLDVMVIGGCLSVIRPFPALPTIPQKLRLSSCLLALPALFLVLWMNVTFTQWIENYFRIQPSFTLGNIIAQAPLQVVLMYCFLPALYEELFFRKAMLGFLLPATSCHAAVWLSATAFGCIHITQLFSIPYLIIAGALFGYLRVYSRSMTLPIMTHAFHNAGVFLYHSWQVSSLVVSIGNRQFPR